MWFKPSFNNLLQPQSSCKCQKIRSVFRVPRIYNFVFFLLSWHIPMSNFPQELTFILFKSKLIKVRDSIFLSSEKQQSQIAFSGETILVKALYTNDYKSYTWLYNTDLKKIVCHSFLKYTLNNGLEVRPYIGFALCLYSTTKV